MKINEIKTNDDSFSNEELKNIREKTFNPELKKLVGKISSHTNPTDSESIMNRDELLEKFHSLFYQVINSYDENKISTELDIFNDKEESLVEQCLSSLENIIEEIGISEYSFMFYSTETRVFEPHIMNMPEEAEKGLFISPAEDIYTDLIHSEKGLIINEKYLRDKSIVFKRFSFNGKLNEYYCVSLDQILSDFWDQLDGISASALKLHNLYPLLMVKINESFNSDKAKMFQVIRNKLSMHLYIIYSHMREKEIAPELRNPSYVSRMLDTHSQIMSHQKALKCYILKYKKEFTNEIFLLMKFMYSKIDKFLSVKSSIRHIEKNKILMFIHDDDFSTIEKLIEDFNKLYDYNFTFIEIEDYQHINLLYIMQI